MSFLSFQQCCQHAAKKEKEVWLWRLSLQWWQRSPSLNTLLSSNYWCLLLLSCEIGNSYKKNPNSNLELLFLYWNNEENNLAGDISISLRPDKYTSDALPTDCPPSFSVSHTYAPRSQQMYNDRGLKSYNILYSQWE